MLSPEGECAVIGRRNDHTAGAVDEAPFSIRLHRREAVAEHPGAFETIRPQELSAAAVQKAPPSCGDACGRKAFGHPANAQEALRAKWVGERVRKAPHDRKATAFTRRDLEQA